MSENETLEKIRKEIEESMKTRLGKDFNNVLDKVTTQLFTEKSHFIMEITQNAEDEIRKRGNEDGTIKFYISTERIKIEHNGKSFDDMDVNSICGVRSNKKPNEDYIGYMGIGFKSVFSITNKAQIFSDGFCFKFDEGECPSPLPWFITPLEAKSSERLDKDMTTFIFPFKTGEDIYQKTKEELEKFGVHLLMFLNCIKNIEICFEDEKETKRIILEKFPPKDGIMRISKNNKIEDFKIFSKELDVPPDISKDPDTIKSERDKIKKRTIMIAFLLGDNRALRRWEQKDKSVYSFLPLENARSGYPFIIQADFVVEPGRRNVNYHIEWNRWLVKEIKKLVEDAINSFQENKSWRKEYFKLFEVEERKDDKVYENLFFPYLIEPIQKYLKEAKIPDIEGNLISVNKAVKASPHGKVVELLDKNDLEIYFGEEGIAFMDVEVHLRDEEEDKIKPLELIDIAKNKDFLQKKRDDIPWFKKLYRFLKDETDLDEIYILTESNELKQSGKLYFNKLPEEIEKLRKESEDVQEMLKKYPFLNSELENDFKEFFEDKKLVSELGHEQLCEDVFLPKISTEEASKPEKDMYDNIVNYTVFVKSANLTDVPIWIISKNEKIISSEEILMSSDYSSEETWDDYEELLPFEFISSRYLKYGDNDEWCTFFKELGVKTKDDYHKLATTKLLTSIRPIVGGDERSPPPKDKLLLFTLLIKKYCGDSEYKGVIWAITKSNDEIIPSDKGIFFGSVYSPQEDWEKNKHYLEDRQGVDLKFLTEDYIQDKRSGKEIDEWRKFLLMFGVKEKGDKKKHIGKFGESYVKIKLQHKLKNLRFVDEEDRGYDLIGENENGKQIYIEVKGRTDRTEDINNEDIELSINESRSAGMYKHDFWVCIVTNIPDNPRLYLIQDPSENGIKRNIVIPKDKWQAFDEVINF